MQMLSNPPSTTASGIMDSDWAAWQEATVGYGDYFAGQTKVNFWMVVALPGGSFSEQLEEHESLPMLVPTSGCGEFLGTARTKVELDKMLVEDKKNVHLTYKVKIQGQQDWRDLLEFLGNHDMLEKE